MKAERKLQKDLGKTFLQRDSNRKGPQTGGSCCWSTVKGGEAEEGQSLTEEVGRK